MAMVVALVIIFLVVMFSSNDSDGAMLETPTQPEVESWTADHNEAGEAGMVTE